MMKRWSPIFIIFAVLVGILPNSPVSAANIERSHISTYDQKKVYPGSYDTNVTYYRPSKKTFWRPGLNGFFPENVRCLKALNSLMQSGLWKGNLINEGDCGPIDEPAEWAVGNRLNFDEGAIPSNIKR
jgi:hypothetical protein